MFNVDGMSGQNRDMTREALEIILKLWSEPAPFTYKGKFWTVTKPDTMFDFLKPHLKPVQAPHPPIGVAGLSKNSDTLKLAGERGFIPMSLNLNPAYVGSHWDSVEAGAAKTGRKPNRQRLAAGARGVRRRHRRGGLEALGRRHDGPDDGRVFPAAARPFRLQGLSRSTSPTCPTATSPSTIAPAATGSSARPRPSPRRSRQIYHEVGGFGVLLVFGFDYKHKPEAWHHSLQLLKHEVMPRLKHLNGDLVRAA